MRSMNERSAWIDQVSSDIENDKHEKGSAVTEPKIKPRLLSCEQAAHYVGLSPNAFEQEVAAGTFPAPVELARVRRRLWDIKAIDAAIDKAMGLMIREDDRERRKREWLEEQARRPSANRPWLERERRERQ